MPDFIVRLYSDSVIRLCPKPYVDRSSTVSLDFRNMQVAVFDNIKEVQPDVYVPSGLILQVKVSASDIEEGIAFEASGEGYVLSVMSVAAMAAATNAVPQWAYDATDDIKDKEYRYYFYEGVGPRASRCIDIS